MCQVMITSDRNIGPLTENSFHFMPYAISCSSLNSSTMSAPPPPPQSFPYDHLFKILTIGDAGVGKVREAVEYFCACASWYQFSSGAGFGLRRRGETVTCHGRSVTKCHLFWERAFAVSPCYTYLSSVSKGIRHYGLYRRMHSCRLSLYLSHRHSPFLSPLLLPLGSHQSSCGSPTIPSMITYSPQLVSTSR